MMLAPGLVVAILLQSPTAGPAGQPAPPRDLSAAAAKTGTVRGRVIGATGGQPLHRVRVTLNGAAVNPPSGVTDTRGRFEIPEVPPGTYSVTAVRAGYLTVQYGQRRPREAGRTITIASGQTIENVDFALPRGGVLSGRISDETGDPSPGVRVEATELRYIRGRRVAVPARITTTNDAGEYRLSGLDPGAYQIRASSTEVWEGDDGKETFVYGATAFPGVLAADRPQSITVPLGQEVSGLDFQLIPGRAARISGVVEDAAGAPIAGQPVNVDRITRTVGGALMSAGFGGRAKTDERGAFELGKLAPGEYTAYTGGPNDTVSASVVVSDGETKSVVLTPRKPNALSGTVVTDEGGAPPFPAARLTVVPVPTAAQSVLPLWGETRSTTLRADWTFRAASLDGPYLFRVTGLPDDWMLKAVRLGGREITDTPLTVVRAGPDVDGLQVILSRGGGKIGGEVADGPGGAGADATVVVFAEDRALWGVASRFVRAVRPDDRGRFSIAGLPASTYCVIARDAIVDGQWEEPDFLEGFVKDATRVTVKDGAAETLTLRSEAIR